MAGNAGSGRKPGSKNKDTRELEAIAERLGVNPFEVLCEFAKGNDADRALSAAITMCKYLYPQRKAVEISSADDGFKIIIEDYVSKK